MSFQEQTTIRQGTGEDEKLKTRSLWETLQNEEFRSFAGAAEAAGLSGLLRGPGNHTVLAVRNDEFDEKNIDVRRMVLRNRVLTPDMRTAGQLTPVEGEPVSVDWNGGDVRVAGMKIRRADIACTNGVIHEVEFSEIR
jgi:uncharacterized surface protein with fasciclin (FAS1) repeats